MDYKTYIQEAIKRNSRAAYLEKPETDAEYQSKLYTGKGLDKLITEFRKSEDDDQKSSEQESLLPGQNI